MTKYKCTICGHETEVAEGQPAPEHCGKPCELVTEAAPAAKAAPAEAAEQAQ